MKETQFIRQNQDKWIDFEEVLQNSDKDPDKLHDVFIQITDDLSHARTFYPSRSVRAYLNGVAQVIFTDLNKSKKSPLSKVRFFFTDELPQVIYESRWSFFWALMFFVISFAVGYFSSVKDPDFVRTILGDSYVNMTAENIKSGDPMKVYKESGRFDMTFGIMLNNMWVTLLYFVLGIFAGFGSVAMMMYNGIMVGCFLQYFAQNNLLKEANLTIWMHGTLEISAIVIGTAAGMTMGRGLLFPGTYTRLQSFQMSARRGIKIMTGVMIMLFFAALIEGNLTRHTELGDGFRGAFIAINLAAILFYYAWYPFYKAKKGFKKPLREAHLPPDNFYKLDFYKIKNSGEIFSDTFIFFKRYIKTYMRLAIGSAIVFCLAVFGLTPDLPNDIFKLETNLFTQHFVVAQFFDNEHIPFLAIVNTVLYSVMAFWVCRTVVANESQAENSAFTTEMTQAFNRKGFAQIAVVTLFTCFFQSLGGFSLTIYYLLLAPFIGLWIMLVYRDGFNPFSALKHAWWLFTSGSMLTLGSHYIMLLIGYLFYSSFNSILLYFYMMFVGWNFSFLSDGNFDQMVVVIMSFVASFVLFINMLLLFTAYAFTYYSLLEINEANSILDKIEQIGQSKKIQGLARE